MEDDVGLERRCRILLDLLEAELARHVAGAEHQLVIEEEPERRLGRVAGRRTRRPGPVRTEGDEVGNARHRAHVDERHVRRAILDIRLTRRRHDDDRVVDPVDEKVDLALRSRE